MITVGVVTKMLSTRALLVQVVVLTPFFSRTGDAQCKFTFGLHIDDTCDAVVATAALAREFKQTIVNPFTKTQNTCPNKLMNYHPMYSAEGIGKVLANHFQEHIDVEHV